ncbi:MAG: MarR family winged helix-turn-helix transcriptional regulator [Chitinophagaceae bacterium]|jgi:DNA-binding MarR family transcriptional regulator
MIQKTLNASLIFHIIKLAETWRKNGEEICNKEGITTQQWLILLLLANDPNIVYLQEHPQQKPLMASEIATAMNVSRANITNLLIVLMDKDLVQQIEDDIDRRRKRLILTTKGKQIVENLEPLRNQFNNNLFKHFAQSEKEEVMRFANKCLQLMPH